MNDKNTTKTFISNIVDKNYSEANKSLHKMVENKIKERIKSSVVLKK
jgi:hypothetical protein